MTTSSDTGPASVSLGSFLERSRRYLGAPFRLQTYRNLLYLALAFPLGLLYLVGFVTAAALGVGLLITWIGLPILLATLAVATAVAGVEAALARRLGGVQASIPSTLREFDPADGLAVPGDGFLAAIERLVTARATRTSVALLLAKFGFGLVALVALLVSVALTGGLLAAPFVYNDPAVTIGLGGVVVDGSYTVAPWIVDTYSEALLAAGSGVVALFVSVNLLNALAAAHARSTAALLEGDDPDV